MDTTWPVLTPPTPQMRWFQRGLTLLFAAGAVTPTALLAVDGLAAWQWIVWAFGLALLFASAVATWRLSGSWPGRVANPEVLRASRWRDRRAARRALLDGRELDAAGRRHAAVAVATWSIGVGQVPFFGTVVGFQLALLAVRTDPDAITFFGPVVIAIGFVGFVAAAVSGSRLPAAARRAGTMPEILDHAVRRADVHTHRAG